MSMTKAKLITPVRYNGVRYTVGEGEFPSELVKTRPELFGLEEKEEKKTSKAIPTKGTAGSNSDSSNDTKSTSKSNSGGK